MKKRALSLLIALCLVIGLIPEVFAGRVALGRSREGFDWELDSEGILTISGNGKMEDFSPAGGGYTSWIDANLGYEYADQIKKIILSPGITNVGTAAFDYCRNLVSIEIPDTVTSIGNYAFLCCFNLESVVIPDGVTTIGKNAFQSCLELPSITIPKSVIEIQYGAFGKCAMLRSITFEGDAPAFGYDDYMGVFEDVTATAYYPYGNQTWTADVMQDYGGKITWVPLHPTPFIDVPADSFYCKPVLWALENGITNGATADRFDPSGECLRAHVVTFLHRAEGSPDPFIFKPISLMNPFTDVKRTDFFYKPVIWAVQHRITNGVSSTEFGPYNVCNRAAVVTFLWRAAGSPEPESTDNPFTDMKDTDFFYKPVLWAIENGITNGVDATHFGPTTTCNRAQVVTFLYRVYN